MTGIRGQRSELTFIDILSKKKIYNEETIVFMFEILHSLCSFRMTGVLEVETGNRSQESEDRDHFY